jgi:hypothetical protein
MVCSIYAHVDTRSVTSANMPTAKAPPGYGAPLKSGNALPAPLDLGEVGEVGKDDGDAFAETYGRGGGAGMGDEDEGEGGSSSYGTPASIPNSSMMPRGGGRSTMASRSCRMGMGGEIWEIGRGVVEIETRRTSRRRSSPAYSPSISSGPSNTVPLRNISPSSSTQLFDLSSQTQTQTSISAFTTWTPPVTRDTNERTCQ